MRQENVSVQSHGPHVIVSSEPTSELSLIHGRFKFICFVAIAQGANWYKLSNKEAVLVEVTEKAVKPSVPGQKGEEICTITFAVETF